jgi:hypothetical protein
MRVIQQLPNVLYDSNKDGDSTSARNGPVYHTETSCSTISYRHLPTYTISDFFFIFLMVRPCFAFNKYTSTSKFPFEDWIQLRKWMFEHHCYTFNKLTAMMIYVIFSRNKKTTFPLRFSYSYRKEWSKLQHKPYFTTYTQNLAQCKQHKYKDIGLQHRRSSSAGLPLNVFGIKTDWKLLEVNVYISFLFRFVDLFHVYVQNGFFIFARKYSKYNADVIR